MTEETIQFALRTAAAFAEIGNMGYQIVLLPHGLQHHTTTAFAVTEREYEVMGGTEKSWWIDSDCKRCDADAPGARLHRSKELVIAGNALTIFPPVDVGDDLPL